MALRSGLSFAVGALLLTGLAWWFGIGGVVRALRQAAPGELAAYVGLSLAVLALQATRWRVVAAAVGAPMGGRRAALARLAGDGVASLLPLARVAGDPLRAVLAREGSTRLAPASAGVAIDRLLELIGNSLAVIAYVAVFSVAAVGAGSARTAWSVGGAVGALLLLLLALIWQLARGGRPLAPLYGARAQAWLGDRAHWLAGVRRVEAHLGEFFRGHRATFLAGMMLTVLIELTIVFQYRALLAAFAVHLDLPVLLLVLLGGGLARAVPTPGALGTLEAAQVLAVGATTGQAELGFVVGIIVRLHETLLVLAGMAALSLLGFSPTRLPNPRQVPTS